ncbi:metallophosphoesterase [Virgisporangium ochraceum]
MSLRAFLERARSTRPVLRLRRRSWRPAFVRRPRVRRTASALGVIAVSVVGVVIGVLLAGSTTDDVGPFEARYSVIPSLTGGTEVAIPPLGSLHLASHYGPAHLQVTLQALDQERTQAIVTDPNALERASDGAVDDVSRGVRRLIWQVAGASVLGAMLLGALIYRSARRVAGCGAIALVMVLGTGMSAAGTFRAQSIQEPRFEGLLVNAPAVVGDARAIADRYEEYRDQLQRLVANVGRIYGTVSNLPVYEPDTTTTRVLHVSDLHLNPAAWSIIGTVVEQFDIDMVVDTGDINDWGSEPEGSYVDAIAALRVPYVFIRGNHDSASTAAAVARQPNATVLDNTVTEIDGLVIAGISDPRFTPDKTADGAASVEGSGESLAATVRVAGRPVNLAMVHDPIAAEPRAGVVPLVLAGHRHKREITRLDQEDGRIPPEGRTLLMVQGSTGGAGLRGLEKEEPTPLEMSVLYFDDTDKSLQAYDDITVGGTGQSEVTLQRNLVRPDDKAPVVRSPSPSVSGSTSGSGSGSPFGAGSPSPS